MKLVVLNNWEPWAGPQPALAHSGAWQVPRLLHSATGLVSLSSCISQVPRFLSSASQFSSRYRRSFLHLDTDSRCPIRCRHLLKNSRFKGHL